MTSVITYLATKRPSNTAAIAIKFFALYIAGVCAKLSVQLDLDSITFLRVLLAINTIELCLWLITSNRYYKGGQSHIGLILLYSIMAIYVIIPLALLVSDFDIFPFAQDTIQNAMLAQSMALTHFYLFIHLLIGPSLIKRTDAVIIKQLDKLEPTATGELIASIIGITIACLYYFNFINSGVSEIVGTASRITIAKTAETGKTWLLQYLFFAWLMAVSAASLFRNQSRKTPILARSIQLLAIVLFMHAYLLIGNRREFAIFLLFLLMLSIYRKRRYLSIVVILSFPMLLSIGLLRALEGSAVGDIDVSTNLLNIFGEFVFPHYSLMYYSDQPALDLMFGQSYLLLPFYALPSFGLWEKATSLSINFASEYANLSMGFAFTPLAEGYVNFGWSSVIITPLMLAFTFRVFFQHARLMPYGILVLTSFSLDISRGEFTTVAFQWFIFALTVTLITRIYTSSIPRGMV